MSGGKRKTAPELVGPDFSVPGKPALYFLAMKEVPFVKIGKADNWKDRCREHQCASPFHMEVIMLIEGDGKVETAAHCVFRHSRWRGEWFHFDANFKATLKAVEDARGDVGGLFKRECESNRERVLYWSTLTSLTYGISDLARELARPKPCEMNLKQRAANRERLRRWRTKKRLEKAAADSAIEALLPYSSAGAAA